MAVATASSSDQRAKSVRPRHSSTSSGSPTGGKRRPPGSPPLMTVFVGSLEGSNLLERWDDTKLVQDSHSLLQTTETVLKILRAAKVGLRKYVQLHRGIVVWVLRFSVFFSGEVVPGDHLSTSTPRLDSCCIATRQASMFFGYN